MTSLFKYRQYIITSAKSKLLADVVQNHLGILWWFLEPILQMAVYFFVFSVLLKHGTPNFVSFLLIGISVWTWFSSSVTQGVESISASGGLMRQVHFPKAIMPIITILVRSARFLMVLFTLLIFLAIKDGLYASWLTLPALVGTQLLLVSAVTVTVAAIVPFIPDLAFVINAALQAVMFGSGVFFEIKPEENHYDLFMLNPMAKLMEQYRIVLMQGQMPQWGYLAVISLVSILYIPFIFMLITKLDHYYPRVAK